MFKFLSDKISNIFREIGQYGLLLFQAMGALSEWRTYYKNVIIQMSKVGVDSLPIVMLASGFSGAVFTVQTINQMTSPFIPLTIVGAIVVPSFTLELAALVAAFMLAGRVGARIAAELGTMRVSEQIDALEAMGLNSVSYLVIPRVIAGIMMFPVLYIAACIVGIGGGVFAASLSGLPPTEFIAGAKEFFHPYDIVFGLVKSFVFGFLITSVSCYKGYFTSGGAEGVGNGTTQAAVMSCVAILFADLILAVLLL